MQLKCLDAAVKGLFTNKTIIICEKNKTNEKFVDLAINIFKYLKMNISFMDLKRVGG